MVLTVIKATDIIVHEIGNSCFCHLFAELKRSLPYRKIMRKTGLEKVISDMMRATPIPDNCTRKILCSSRNCLCGKLATEENELEKVCSRIKQKALSSIASDYFSISLP